MDVEANLKELQKKQDDLQKAFEASQELFQKAKVQYDEVKQALTVFNDKYGRVLQLIKEE